MADNTEKRLGDRLEAMDTAILGWAKTTKKELLMSMARMGVKDKAKMAKTMTRIKFRKGQVGGKKVEKEEFLYQSLRYSLKKKNFEIESINFKFAKHGLYLEHGVGKGRGKSSGKADQYAKPWLSNVLPAAIERLNNLLAEEYADIAAAELVMTIPGVIKTRANVSSRTTSSTVQRKHIEEVEDAFLAALNEDIRRMQANGVNSGHKRF